MPSRRKRKRERRNAEATANSPNTLGGWGDSLPTMLADLVMLRRAVNEDWPVPANVRQAVIDELKDELETSDPRRVLSAVRLVLAMESANVRAERIG